MLRLEVLGKLLLLAAELPAAFDLVKPEMLRRWSERSSQYLEKRKEFQIVADIAQLRYVIRLAFVRASVVASPHGPVVTGEKLHGLPPVDRLYRV